MSQNPVNLVVRFLLELAAPIAMGYWGWTQFDGIWHYILAIGIPLLAAYIWGTYRVPNDGGTPRVRVPGTVRFVIEIVFFTFATWALFNAGGITAGWIFGSFIILHYLVSYDRIIWLVRQ